MMKSWSLLYASVIRTNRVACYLIPSTSYFFCQSYLCCIGMCSSEICVGRICLWLLPAMCSMVGGIGAFCCLSCLQVYAVMEVAY